MRLQLQWLTATEADQAKLVAASALFDAPVTGAGARAFLAQPNHHLCLGYLDDEAAGFVTGIELSHPDKGTEMFLYELGVDERFRRRGLGRALVAALAERAVTLGCYGMWTLTEPGNVEALATYRSAGGSVGESPVLLEWAGPPAS